MTVTDDYGWAALEAVDSPVLRQYRHYRPFDSAIADFTEEAQESNRIYLGVDELDAQIRGVGGKHLVLLNGYTHSGKTLFARHILRHNRLKRVAWFTPDESASMQLASLASMQLGVEAEELERRLQEDDAEAKVLLRQVVDEFPNLAVFEEPLTIEYLMESLDECEKAWGAKHELVVIDYLKLLRAGDDMDSKYSFAKSLSKTRGPVLALNQTSRSAGADGREMTISSGEYGGEDYATFVLGVRRKKFEYAAIARDLRAKATRAGRGGMEAEERLREVNDLLDFHEHTITVNAVKVKRVGGRNVDEIDFELDHVTGRLIPLHGRWPSGYRSIRADRTAPPPPPFWEQEEFGDY